MKKECEARLRELVPESETIVAVGTAEELRKLGPDIGSGGGWTFVVVTLERVLFADWGSPLTSHEEIRLDEVTSWAHGSQCNCYALALTHPPMTRRERVPAHRILWVSWGVSDADVTRTQTMFRFSRPETEVTQALRTALEERGVPDRLLRFKERSREERTRGSRTALFAKRQ
ncbi:MAG: hypothetical protein ACRDKF_07890 [Actinomycetota bacterium]